MCPENAVEHTSLSRGLALSIMQVAMILASTLQAVSRWSGIAEIVLVAYLLVWVLLAINRAISGDKHGPTSMQVPCHGSSRLADGSHVFRAPDVATAVIAPVPVLEGSLDEGIIIYHGSKVIALVVGVQAVAHPFPVPLWPAQTRPGVYSNWER